MIMMLVVEPKKLLLLCKVFKCNDYHVSSWNLNIANVVLSLLKQIDCVAVCLFRNRWQMSWVHLWFSLTSFVSLLWSVIVLTHGNMESILYGKKKNVVEGDVISIDHEQEPIKNACAIQLFIQCAVLEPWHSHCCSWSTFVVVKMFKSNSNVLFEQQMAVWSEHIIINDRFPLRYWSWMDLS